MKSESLYSSRGVLKVSDLPSTHLGSSVEIRPRVWSLGGADFWQELELCSLAHVWFYVSIHEEAKLKHTLL